MKCSMEGCYYQLKVTPGLRKQIEDAKHEHGMVGVLCPKCDRKVMEDEIAPEYRTPLVEQLLQTISNKKHWVIVWKAEEE